MADVRLIDANALRNVFDAMHAVPGGSHLEHLLLLGIKKYIDDAPTIDAVQVVRCRECRNSRKLMTSADQVYCLVWNEKPRSDGYCYLGAKKNGDAEGCAE